MEPRRRDSGLLAALKKTLPLLRPSQVVRESGAQAVHPGCCVFAGVRGSEGVLASHVREAPGQSLGQAAHACHGALEGPYRCDAVRGSDDGSGGAFGSYWASCGEASVRRALVRTARPDIGAVEAEGPAEAAWVYRRPSAAVKEVRLRPVAGLQRPDDIDRAILADTPRHTIPATRGSQAHQTRNPGRGRRYSAADSVPAHAEGSSCAFFPTSTTSVPLQFAVVGLAGATVRYPLERRCQSRASPLRSRLREFGPARWPELGHGRRDICTRGHRDCPPVSVARSRAWVVAPLIQHTAGLAAPALAVLPLVGRGSIGPHATSRVLQEGLPNS